MVLLKEAWFKAISGQALKLFVPYFFSICEMAVVIIVFHVTS